MKDFFYQRQWNWKVSGIALGLAFLLAVVLVKPIGVSTQFVIILSIEKCYITQALCDSIKYKPI